MFLKCSYLHKEVEDEEWDNDGYEDWCTVGYDHQGHDDPGQGGHPDPQGDGDVGIQGIDILGKAVQDAPEWGGVKEGERSVENVDQKSCVQFTRAIDTTNRYGQ